MGGDGGDKKKNKKKKRNDKNDKKKNKKVEQGVTLFWAINQHSKDDLSKLKGKFIKNI